MSQSSVQADDVAVHPLPDWAMAALAVPNGSDRIDVDGCSIHYLYWGRPDNPPLVLIHGNAAHAEWWRFVAPLLADDYFVVAVDLGGMGDSGHCGRYERERYVEQVMAVADAVAPGRLPWVVGHSLGGYIALMAGISYADRVAGVIAIDSPIEPPGEERPSVLAQFKVAPDVYATKEDALRRFRLVPRQEVGCDFYLEHIARHSVAPVENGWRWKFDPPALVHPRPVAFAKALQEFRCPVALFYGQLSARIEGPLRDYMRDTFGPLMPVIELPNCRHHVMLDEPLLLVAALRTQLANWRAPQAE